MTIKGLTIEYYPRYSHNPARAHIEGLTGMIKLEGGLKIESPLDNKKTSIISPGDYRRSHFLFGDDLENTYPPALLPQKIELPHGRFQFEFTRDGATIIISGNNLNAGPKLLEK